MTAVPWLYGQMSWWWMTIRGFLLWEQNHRETTQPTARTTLGVDAVLHNRIHEIVARPYFNRILINKSCGTFIFIYQWVLPFDHLRQALFITFDPTNAVPPSCRANQQKARYKWTRRTISQDSTESLHWHTQILVIICVSYDPDPSSQF